MVLEFIVPTLCKPFVKITTTKLKISITIVLIPVAKSVSILLTPILAKTDVIPAKKAAKRAYKIHIVSPVLVCLF